MRSLQPSLRDAGNQSGPPPNAEADFSEGQLIRQCAPAGPESARVRFATPRVVTNNMWHSIPFANSLAWVLTPLISAIFY
jgi:hypothetical protein